MSPDQGAAIDRDHRAAHELLPPGAEDVLRRVITLLLNPTPQTWEDAHDIVLNAERGLTLWQALQHLDSSCPRAKTGDGAAGWSGYAPWPLVAEMAIEHAMADTVDETTKVDISWRVTATYSAAITVGALREACRKPGTTFLEENYFRLANDEADLRCVLGTATGRLRKTLAGGFPEALIASAKVEVTGCRMLRQRPTSPTIGSKEQA